MIFSGISAFHSHPNSDEAAAGTKGPIRKADPRRRAWNGNQGQHIRRNSANWPEQFSFEKFRQIVQFNVAKNHLQAWQNEPSRAWWSGSANGMIQLQEVKACVMQAWPWKGNPRPTRVLLFSNSPIEHYGKRTLFIVL
jgi:hypothetical protein